MGWWRWGGGVVAWWVSRSTGGVVVWWRVWAWVGADGVRSWSWSWALEVGELRVGAWCLVLDGVDGGGGGGGGGGVGWWEEVWMR